MPEFRSTWFVHLFCSPFRISLDSRPATFTAINPYRIDALSPEHPDLREQVANGRLVNQWPWSVTRDWQYLVCAVTVERG